MRFAQIMTWKSGVAEELRTEWIKRRAEWKPPADVTVLAEFLIPTGGNKVMIIYEAEGKLPQLMAMRAPWMKYFDVDVYPAVAMEEIIQAAPKLLEALR